MPLEANGLGASVVMDLVLQPSLGFGLASSHAPKPAQARLESLATHSVFGVGLYVCALGVSHLLRASA